MALRHAVHTLVTNRTVVLRFLCDRPIEVNQVVIRRSRNRYAVFTTANVVGELVEF
ncbi:hypothetical protein PAXRUDRAFT_833113 [Paxillus rubicundulus Ve08.2h10]|uniref:Unplaced genomic scaffold scaffold_1054, whole genome shotgun sequence n=1 Tax=Paxillus rubicundulus Ve08.2h10 TaxID=930991 RepID=A0A0D0CED5_9AGAM|nr:hypothetical protein PAXRUDRAFT_833113 [Paxillus rubicundulus Ve08.2h10]